MKKPDKTDIDVSVGVCCDAVNYFTETEPQATHGISVLEEASWILSALADEKGEEEGNETEDSE